MVWHLIKSSWSSSMTMDGVTGRQAPTLALIVTDHLQPKPKPWHSTLSSSSFFAKKGPNLGGMLVFFPAPFGRAFPKFGAIQIQLIGSPIPRPRKKNRMEISRKQKELSETGNIFAQTNANKYSFAWQSRYILEEPPTGSITKITTIADQF